jgi:O-acetyl-ADP-ribose deacetylase (regulator of RNase III)
VVADQDQEWARCFVIMPFGEKADVKGSIVDFDEIYASLIAPAVKSVGLIPTRSIDVEEAGFIHRRMIENIRDAPVAVVDLSLLNPNVFYELGVRHTLRQFVTVLIRRTGTSIPFNIHGLNVIEYDETNVTDFNKAGVRLAAFIANGLRSGRTDSLVHEVINLSLYTPVKPLTRLQEYCYRVKGTNKCISLITGDLRNVRGTRAVDIWVNSENTNMQMARFYDWSISSLIRYLGAKRDQKNKILDDIINRELLAVMAEDTNVDPGTVIVTSAGELERTHGVKAIFHVAAVAGQVGGGYKPIDDLPVCIANALDMADSSEWKSGEPSSILFPLLGAGVAAEDLSQIVQGLFERAVAYVVANPLSAITRVCFLAWSEEELRTCRTVLASFKDLADAEELL